jgi:DNA-binding response OmpR family regulator
MNKADRVTILNVDDQDAQRYVKTRDLQRAGFDVLEAKTGAEALQCAEQHAPPIILLDVQLPDINGYQVCRYVKQRSPATMILMTSATFTTSADRTIGLDSGADAFLVQPAEPLELAACVNALLRIRRSEEELRKLNDTLEQRIQDRVTELAQANAALRSEMVQRQAAEAALVQAEKMQAVGQLTGGLAHDFNNLLTAVVGNLDMIQRRSTDHHILRLADNALKASQRGAKLTSQLLAFSRTQKLELTPVDVNALLAGMHNLLKQSLGAAVAIKIEPDAGRPLALADATQLELAILNLGINSRDAMPQGGTLTITTAICSTNVVTVVVSDTGSGMPPEVASRAFDPFFTTKPPGKGTGLGLSQVFGAITQCGGEVVLESDVGKGTTVTLRLPRADVKELPGAVAELTAIEPGTARLLIVDDDPDVREFVTTFLSDAGYKVSAATQGEDALKMVKDIRPDMVIIDYAMPGMNGAEVVVTLRQRYPELPVLFVSGFADSHAVESAVGTAPLLRKPFRPAQLAAAVRSMLDARSDSKQRG